MLLIIYTLLLFQQVPLPDFTVNEKAFEISPTNVYGWLIYGLLGFIAYLKLESTLKSWTIRKKDRYIETLHQKLLESEKTSITAEEAELYNKILSQKKETEPTQ